MLFLKKSEGENQEVWLEMQYSKCVARGFHTVLSMKKNASFQFNSPSKVPEIGLSWMYPQPKIPKTPVANEGLAWDFSSLKIYLTILVGEKPTSWVGEVVNPRDIFLKN